MEKSTQPDYSRLDLRTDADIEYMVAGIAQRTGYKRPQVLRFALWVLANLSGVPDVPPLERLLKVKPGRKPKAHTPPASEE